MNRAQRTRLIRSRVLTGAVALFVAAWLVIAITLISGNDPALSRNRTTASVATTTAAATTTPAATTTAAATTTPAATTTSSSGTTSSGTTSSGPSSVTTHQS